MGFQDVVHHGHPGEGARESGDSFHMNHSKIMYFKSFPHLIFPTKSVEYHDPEPLPSFSSLSTTFAPWSSDEQFSNHCGP